MHIPDSYEIHREARRWRSREMARLARLGLRIVAVLPRRATARLRLWLHDAAWPLGHGVER